MSLILPSHRLTPAWARNDLWRRARVVPSLDLRFAENKSLVDAISGQNLITFTRASSGTWMDSQGVLRTATTNLLLQSEDFSVTWTNFGSSENTNVAVAPNGTKTADALVDTTTSESHNISQTVTLAASTTYTFSAYLKKGSQRYGALVFSANSSWGTGAGATAYFDLEVGTVAATTATTASITRVGDGWYRCAATATTTAGASSFILRIASSETGASQTYPGAGGEALYIWGAQLEQSSSVGEYIPTGATINSAPRFDHDPTTGECLGLLIEEQRTNSIRNNTMQGAVVGVPGTLPTNWSITLPGGLSFAVVASGIESGVSYVDVRISGTTTASGQIFISPESTSAIVASSGQTWTASWYLSLISGSVTSSGLSVQRIDVSERDASGNLLASAQKTFIPVVAPLSRTRQSVSRTIANASAARVHSAFRIDAANSAAIDFTIRIGMPQLEQGTLATSVIPTSTAAATRNADVATIGGLAFSSWYRQDEGTVFVVSDHPQGLYGTVCEFYQNSLNTIIIRSVTPNIQGLVSVAGVSEGVTNIANASRFRGGFGYALNNVAFSVNGQSPVVDSSSAITTSLESLCLGRSAVGFYRFLNGTIGRLAYWPQRLPNIALQALTQ